jgi:hypothetical protein
MKRMPLDPKTQAGSEYAFPSPPEPAIGKPMPLNLGPQIGAAPIPEDHHQMPGGPSTSDSQYSTQGPIPKG